MRLNHLSKQLEQVIQSSISLSCIDSLKSLCYLIIVLLGFVVIGLTVLSVRKMKEDLSRKHVPNNKRSMFAWNLFTSFCFVNNMMAWQVWSSQVFCWHFLFNTNLHKLGCVIDNTLQKGEIMVTTVKNLMRKNLGPFFCFLHSKVYHPSPSTFIDELVFILNLLFMMVQRGGEDTMDVYL